MEPELIPVSYTHLDVYKRQEFTRKYVTVQMVRQSLGGGEGSLIFSLLRVSRVWERGEGLGITYFMPIPDLTMSCEA